MDILHEGRRDYERTFCGHRATSAGVFAGPRRRREMHYNARPTVVQPEVGTLDGVRGGCAGARRRLL